MVGTAKWYANHRETQLWDDSIPTAGWRARVPQWSVFEEAGPSSGSRLYLNYFGSSVLSPEVGWVEADDLGPIPAQPPPIVEPEWAAAPRTDDRWLANFNITNLWSGPNGSATLYNWVPQFSVFQQVAPALDGRIPVYFFGNNVSPAGVVWVDAKDLGPVGPPPRPVVEPPHPVNGGDLPPQLAGARPTPGLRTAPGASIANILARIFTRARAETSDKGYGEALSALALAEGGMTGKPGDGGRSWGPFQFYWGGGQGNAFQTWLGEPDTGRAQQQALDVDLSLDYYVMRAYRFYQVGLQQGRRNVLAIVSGGHNTNAIGGPEQAVYEDAWRRWNTGSFDGGTPPWIDA
jgi:hypothetical protein